MILVTGGAGFIGSNFIEDWLSGCEEPVLNIDVLNYAGLAANMASFMDCPRHIFVRADITDGKAIADLLAAHRPRAIVHFAAQSHVDRSIFGPDAFLHSNVVGTYTLLEATRSHYAKLDEQERENFRFIQISTDEVFGSLDLSDPGFTEDSPYRPNNPYSASKAAADHFARAWHTTFGLPVIISHSCNNFGPRQHAEKLIPAMITAALAGDVLPIYGDGQQRRDWLYVKDNCAAIRCVLEKGIPGQRYVIGGTDELANIDLVQKLCGVLDELAPRSSPYARLISFIADRPGHDRRYKLDDSRIRKELGWEPHTAFDAALRHTVSWYLGRCDCNS